MAHRCFYYERIEFEDNQIVYIVKAVNGDFEMDVVKFYENGKVLVRENLTCTGMGGYFVIYPGEVYKEKYYKYYYRCYRRLEMPLNPEWLLKDKLPNLFTCNFADIDYDLIVNNRPELKYFINKYRKHGSNGRLFMNLLIQYKKNSNIEPLIGLGYFTLALNNSLQRLSSKKLKEVVNFIKNDTHVNEYTQLKMILQCIKHSCSLNEYGKMYALNFDKKLFNIVNQANVSSSYYYDYLNMAKKVGHDILNDYWKYPSNLIEFHNRVLEENKILEETMNERNNIKLEEVLKNIIKYNSNIDGYDVFVSTKYSEYRYVCDTLHQCLITANYIQKVIDQDCIIVFIWKDGVPVATAQVFYDKKIGQFYADEIDRKNCYPTDEVRNVLYKYLEKVVLRKRKVNFDNLVINKEKNFCFRSLHCS